MPPTAGSAGGEHLVVLRLSAIGTADWTPQFVDLLEAADTAAAGLDG